MEFTHSIVGVKSGTIITDSSLPMTYKLACPPFRSYSRCLLLDIFVVDE